MGEIYQKFRAHRFDDMVGQQGLVENIRNQSRLNAFFHAYLLIGWYGSGKTTMARLIAMAANCHHKDDRGNPCGECPTCRAIIDGTCGDVTEIDGASNTGADNIRSLKETLMYAPLTTDKKVIIIDEVHMLSTAAFNALLKTLEEPPEHVIFVLATTDAQKVLNTIKSRCFTYTFGRIPVELIAGHVREVADAEHMAITDGAVNMIARNSDGAMRNALKMLEQVGSVKEEITEEVIAGIIGASDAGMVTGLLSSIASCDKRKCLEEVMKAASVGKNFGILCGDLLTAVTDLVKLRCGKPVSASDEYLDALMGIDADLDLLFELSYLIFRVKNALRDDSSEPVFLAALMEAIKGVEEARGMVKVAVPVVSELPAAEPVPAVAAVEPVMEPASSQQTYEPEPAPAYVPETPKEEAVVSTEPFVLDEYDDPLALLESITSQQSPAAASAPDVSYSSSPFDEGDSSEPCDESPDEGIEYAEHESYEVPSFLYEGATEQSRKGFNEVLGLMNRFKFAALCVTNGLKGARHEESGLVIETDDVVAKQALGVLVDTQGTQYLKVV